MSTRRIHPAGAPPHPPGSAPARPASAIVGGFRLSLAVLLLAGAGSASAHSTLQSAGSDGQATLRLDFSAPVESRFLRICAGDSVRLTAIVDPADAQTILVSLPSERVSELRWRVLSRDGHVTEGRLDPVVGDGESTAIRDPVSVAADAIVVAALLGLLGLVAVRFGVIAPAWQSGGVRPPGAGSAIERWQSALDASLRRGLRAWWRVVGAMMAAAAAGLVLAVVGLLRELDSSDVAALVATHWGIAWMVQTAGLGLAAAVAIAFTRSSHSTAPDPPQGWGAAAAIPLVIGAIAISWAGHAASGTDQAIGIGTDALHLLATGAWLGGLAGLLAVVRHARRWPDAADATRFRAAVVVRFSTLAIVCVATLTVTGVYRSIAELTAWSDLVDTGYGQALLVKLIVFAVLLIGGGYNRLVLHPRLERAALGLRDDDGGAGRALGVSVAAELAVAAVLLVIVAVLVNLPPP